MFTDDLSEAASQFTPENIADYLHFLKLNDVDGDMMFDGIDDDTLETVLGVDITKDGLKIKTKSGSDYYARSWLKKIKYMYCQYAPVKSRYSKDYVAFYTFYRDMYY